MEAGGGHFDVIRSAFAFDALVDVIAPTAVFGSPLQSCRTSPLANVTCGIMQAISTGATRTVFVALCCFSCGIFYAYHRRRARKIAAAVICEFKLGKSIAAALERIGCDKSLITLVGGHMATVIQLCQDADLATKKLRTLCNETFLQFQSVRIFTDGWVSDACDVDDRRQASADEPLLFGDSQATHPLRLQQVKLFRAADPAEAIFMAIGNTVANNIYADILPEKITTAKELERYLSTEIGLELIPGMEGNIQKIVAAIAELFYLADAYADFAKSISSAKAIRKNAIAHFTETHKPHHLDHGGPEETPMERVLMAFESNIYSSENVARREYEIAIDSLNGKSLAQKLHDVLLLGGHSKTTDGGAYATLVPANQFGDDIGAIHAVFEELGTIVTGAFAAHIRNGNLPHLFRFQFDLHALMLRLLGEPTVAELRPAAYGKVAAVLKKFISSVEKCCKTAKIGGLTVAEHVSIAAIESLGNGKQMRQLELHLVKFTKSLSIEE
ncbi:MAG: hypothetical protein LBB38_04315 [Puniceicoccales bacterium]|jgi:hypothetical protein|nr:hypothetical protein [Puniceicoccales bacterium]